MPDSEIAGLTEDTTPDATDNVYAQDAAGAVDKRVPLSALPVSTAVQAALDAKQPLDADLTDLAAIADAQGDIIVRGAAGWERLAKSGTSTHVLTAGASQPAWAAAAGGVSFPLDNTGATAATDAVTLDVTGDTQLRFVINHDGSIEWGSGSAVADATLSRSAARTLGLAGNLAITIPNAADKGLIVKAAAAQTGNLQEWQNSSGTILFRTRNDGLLVFESGGGMYLSTSTQRVTSATGSFGDVGSFAGGFAIGSAEFLFAVRAASSQTASIQEWRNNADTALLGVTAAGLPRWHAAGNQQTTVGAAGGASALPATPTKYLKVVDSAGTTLVIPAYTA